MRQNSVVPLFLLPNIFLEVSAEKRRISVYLLHPTHKNFIIHPQWETMSISTVTRMFHTLLPAANTVHFFFSFPAHENSKLSGIFMWSQVKTKLNSNFSPIVPSL